jgi:predicted DNA-binding transcriptional regulator YafY
VNTQRLLRRQWRILETLHGRRVGLTIRQLCADVGVSRATVYRDLRLLEEAGLPLTHETTNGEARYKLLGDKLPPLQLSVLQMSAIRLARGLLTPLEGTTLVAELDSLLHQRGTAAGRKGPPIAAGGRGMTAAAAGETRVLDGAIRRKRRVRFCYQGSKDNERGQVREVDPLELRLIKGQTYLNAYDHARGGFRTFKLSRLHGAEELPERAGEHPEYDGEAMFRHAVKAWDGKPVEVVVVLSPAKARFADEWPLPGQRVEPQPDGAAKVRATVAGTTEALSWVLGWGGGVRVLAPEELRRAHLAELRGALGGYEAEARQS